MDYATEAEKVELLEALGQEFISRITGRLATAMAITLTKEKENPDLSEPPFFYATKAIKKSALLPDRKAMEILIEHVKKDMLSCGIFHDIHDIHFRKTKEGFEAIVVLLNNQAFTSMVAKLAGIMGTAKGHASATTFSIPRVFDIPDAIALLKKSSFIKNILNSFPQNIKFNYYSGGVPDSPTTVEIDFTKAAA